MAVVTPESVKILREQTGVGIMDCKNALVAANGNMEEAVKVLREKGLSKAVKRAGKSTSDGMIFSYIHAGSKLGVLLELDCETDFVAKTDDFQNLGREICMHIAAMDPLAVTPEDIAPDVLAKEKEIYQSQAEQTGKPAQVIEKIVQGRVDKFLKENCLLNQEYTRDNTKTIENVIKEVIAKLGENIQIKRFARYSIKG